MERAVVTVWSDKGVLSRLVVPLGEGDGLEGLARECLGSAVEMYRRSTAVDQPKPLFAVAVRGDERVRVEAQGLV